MIISVSITDLQRLPRGLVSAGRGPQNEDNNETISILNPTSDPMPW
jgi:hypothetical protein